jgi:hypothetical protein
VFLRLFDSPVSLQFNLFRGSSEHPINECHDALRGAFQCCKVALDLLLQSVKLYLDFLISAFPSVSVLSCFFQIVFELINGGFGADCFLSQCLQMRSLRLRKLMLTVYHAGVSVFTTDVSALCEQAMFLPMIARNRGANPWGSTRVAALLHTGDLMCAIHWVSPGIGCVALTDELTAFQNHTAAIPAKQRAMIFAASSYDEILAELDGAQDDHNTRLQTYREVYDGLKLPLFLLPCNGTGCLQLRIMGAPNYRELLAKIILKTHYVPPPAGRPMYDALYQSVPFVMAADMDLRRIDAVVEMARSDGLSQIALAALPEQVETVLNRRYRETGKARVFTITDAALRELLGSTAPYTPPDLPFYTSEGSVLDVPPLKAP